VSRGFSRDIQGSEKQGFSPWRFSELGSLNDFGMISRNSDCTRFMM
jgi:hypothetical protein